MKKMNGTIYENTHRELCEACNATGKVLLKTRVGGKEPALTGSITCPECGEQGYLEDSVTLFDNSYGELFIAVKDCDGGHAVVHLSFEMIEGLRKALANWNEKEN